MRVAPRVRVCAPARASENCRVPRASDDCILSFMDKNGNWDCWALREAVTLEQRLASGWMDDDDPFSAECLHESAMEVIFGAGAAAALADAGLTPAG